MAETALTIDLSKANGKQLRQIRKYQERQQWFDLMGKVVESSGTVMSAALAQNSTRAIIGAGACSLITRVDEQNKYFWGALAAGIVAAEIAKDIGLWEIIF